ncbi:sigma-54-dependent transcriptional regulator [Desulfurivibrio dismutans]|uniref:sigma-54-dependent transcriptional regulator n=1 Tax=Desulfurivibrio dismutans TaxID=1398908 RepID=UPI0023DBAB8C|nr:sigma-54 dependent transcriptional regulator [Desulfurivibrio alkaliphilus]MDF1614615.1 sigma-54 dependent transcriptional regulator [Desulfurivibrio alkaliphilus]
MGANTYPNQPILLVDDEEHALASFDIALKTHGINNTIRCPDGRRVLDIVADTEVEVILLDLIMPGISGQELLSQLNERHPEIPVIVVTGVNEVETAVDCMRRGAFDYLVKPVKTDQMLPSVTRALEIRQLRRENSLLADRFFTNDLSNPEAFTGIITEHPKMQTVFQYCEAVAEGRQPVLITGETGVGKEEIAKALHRLSKRRGRFVTVNVAGLDDQLFTDTLFGHAKGAFTGADQTRPGLVEKAKGGTLFLDEIGDLSPTSQVKLLRFLETREYYPLGSDQAKESDARVLVATHKDPEQLRAAGALRHDLYYRLRTHHVHLPPLRERTEDIPLLLDHFLGEAAKEFRKKKPVYHQEIIPLLKNYYFPGNIRELRAMVFDAMSGHRARLLRTETFIKAVQGKLGSPDQPRPSVPTYDTEWAQKLDRLPTLKVAAMTLVQEALRRSGNNQRVAASLLGITPQALNQRLKRQ